MTIVSHAYCFVIGADTHSRTHTLAVLAAGTGEPIDTAQFPATRTGLARALAWARRRTDANTATLWVIEGVATYGAGLARVATNAGYQVVEAAAMSARAHRGIGKSDPLDARRIAQAVLPLTIEQLRQPRSDEGVRAALRILMAARDQMTRTRTAAVNALIALLRRADLGVDARRTLNDTQIAQISRWRGRDEDIARQTARSEATRLATQIIDLNATLTTNLAAITSLLRDSPANALLDEPGIGPVTAATALSVWSHPGRIHSDAAFAAIAGVSPIPASSGNTNRQRLNHGGDRRLNQALHMAVLVRMRCDPATRAYIVKRTAQGHTTKEIRRCLKRYLARHIYRTLTKSYTPPAAT